MITIGSLFSGIGGLELGVLAAFAEADTPAHVVWQVEIDPFCRAVLARHFPESDRSVIDVRAASALQPVDLIVGGFPCQDVSGAGSGAGLSGERSGLWWAYRDIVRALRPCVVLVENVASGLRRWHGPVRCSLEALGYRTWARQIGAHDVGAPHRRERVFVLAYAHGQRRVEPQGGEPDVRRRDEGERGEREAGRGAIADHMREVGHAEREGREGAERSGACGFGAAPRSARERERAKPEAIGRVGGGPDGVPCRVDLPSRWPAGRGEEQQEWEPPRTVASREEHRRARLKALGNAVVPAQGREAMRWALGVLGWSRRAA